MSISVNKKGFLDFPSLDVSSPVLPDADFYAPLSIGVEPLIGTGSATFTRATSAWYLDDNGVLQTATSGTPRTTPNKGVLIEGVRTNNLLHSRDMTQADWSATDITPLKDATGIDGVANSASTLTATGANGTIFQARTLAAANRTYSAYVKRKTGTGDIFITRNGGSTYTDITSSINSTTWTRVSLTSSVLNPSCGFKIATSGDEIEVDINDDENGANASSPIITTTGTVQRNSDVLSFDAGNVDATKGSFVATVTFDEAATGIYRYVIGLNGVGRPAYFLNDSPVSLRMYDGTTTIDIASALAVGTFKVGSRWGSSVMNLYRAGVAGTEAAFDGNLNGGSFYVGTLDGTQHQLFGWIKDVMIWKTTSTDARMVWLTS